MNRNFVRILFLQTLILVFTCTVQAQVKPTEVSQKLLKKSMKAVLGTDQPIQWEAIDIADLKKQELELKQKRQLPDTLMIGSVQTDKGKRWIVPDIAPSKSETFSYLLYLDEEKKIVDVDVLTYRESYGYEIDYSFFREQFHGKSTPDEIRFGRSIQNISGATISVRSITYSVHDLLTIIQQIELK